MTEHCNLRNRSMTITFRGLLTLVTVIISLVWSCEALSPNFMAKRASKDASSSSSSSSSTRGNDVPYVIMKLDQSEGRASLSEQIEEISAMCIEVFFNPDNRSEGDNECPRMTAPWKELQLAYLRNVQGGDLNIRARGLSLSGGKRKNEMFVVRRVYHTSQKRSSKKRSVRLDDVVNADSLMSLLEEGGEIFAGDVIGFGEVTSKPFGLGAGDEGYPALAGTDTIRPIITNLAVREDCRRFGLGKALVDTICESVTKWEGFGFNEVVLQVEEDNAGGIKFYNKLGFEIVFTDQTCRRYDTSGIFLKQSRIAKICMKKDIRKLSSKSGSIDSPLQLFSDFRESLLTGIGI